MTVRSIYEDEGLSGTISNLLIGGGDLLMAIDGEVLIEPSENLPEASSSEWLPLLPSEMGHQSWLPLLPDVDSSDDDNSSSPNLKVI